MDLMYKINKMKLPLKLLLIGVLLSSCANSVELPEVKSTSLINKEIIKIGNESYVISIPDGYDMLSPDKKEYIGDVVNPGQPWKQEDILKAYISQYIPSTSKTRFVAYGTSSIINKNINQSQAAELIDQMSLVISNFSGNQDQFSQLMQSKKVRDHLISKLGFEVISMGNLNLLHKDTNSITSSSTLDLRFKNGESYKHHYAGSLIVIDGNVILIAAVDISNSDKEPIWHKDLVLKLTSELKALN